MTVSEAASARPSAKSPITPRATSSAAFLLVATAGPSLWSGMASFPAQRPKIDLQFHEAIVQKPMLVGFDLVIDVAHGVRRE